MKPPSREKSNPYSPFLLLPLSLLVVLILARCAMLETPTPSMIPPTDCSAPPLAAPLDDGWQFRTDPNDEGSREGWQTPPFVEDEGWQSLAPGQAWEFSGLEYDGPAWYRTQITLPDWPAVYLGFGGVDDAATLWIDGEEIESWEGLGPRSALLNLREFGAVGDVLSLAFRIEDRGGYGGIKQPLRLGAEPRAVMTDKQYLIQLADAHPNWPMPLWVQGKPFAWTMTGQPDAADEVLVTAGGAVAPWAAAPTAEIWLYDPAIGELAAGTQREIHFSLANGHLPIPKWEWEALGVTVQNTLFGDGQGSATRWLISVRNPGDAPRALTLMLVVRPLAASQDLAPICGIDQRNPHRLRVNGQPFLAAADAPQNAGDAPLQEMMSAVTQGQVPVDTTAAKYPSADGAAAWTYPLELDAGAEMALAFAFPAAPGDPPPSSDADTAARLEASIAAWETSTGKVTIDLPDDFIESGVRASVGYLLLALDPDGPHPGPLAHDALWVRDAAYIGLALLQFGHADLVRAYIPSVLGAQEPSGRVPPIQGENIPWDDDEWDAQGQAIFLVTSTYRHTGDESLLREWYPALRASARFIADLRATRSDAAGPAQGLLPPSKSAEDIGPPNWHHYWDNFWAVAGLEEAAFAARELGQTEDAAWIQTEANALHDAILASVEAVMGPDPAYIPGAVEGLESSAMARGTVPALWPVEVLPREMPLLARSFEHYYQLWIAPHNGGFRHRAGQFWTYGGLDLAHAYLRLGRTDVLHQILGWSLSHQTLPGTFAWAEQVNPADGGFSGGDMPHAWAAAGYATLVREMLFSERSGALDLFTGTPDWWLADGQAIVIENAPTYFGPLSLRTASTLQQSDTAWEGTLTLTLSGAEPPGGYRWRLPHLPHTIDGPSGTVIDGDTLILPSKGGTVRLTFAP